MKINMKIAGMILLVIVILVVATYMCLGFYRHFAPKFQGVKREVFEETKSYNQGKVQELSKYRLEYLKADRDGKAAIESTIRHSFADYEIKRLPDELGEFLKDIRGY